MLSTIFALILFLTSCKDTSRPGTPAPSGINKVGHVIVIYLENHSYDNLYGEFAGANGLSNASGTQTQVDSAGKPLAVLPFVAGSPYPNNLPNQPFDIDQYRPWDSLTSDLVHRYYQEQVQIDGGNMDRYALISDAKGLSMGYYQ